jgi:hypothetical protein
MRAGKIISCEGYHLRIFSGRKAAISLLALWVMLFLSGCSTLQVSLDKTPTANTSAVSTLAALMVEGTQTAALATQISLPPTPLPLSGTAAGRICYPSEHIPPMLAFFKEVNSSHLDKLQIMANQTSYQISLPPGEYVAYAWAPSYQVGGMYSKAVPCGLTDTCTDRSPQIFSVVAGQTTRGIDLCDWIIPINQLPIPAGSELPGP